MPPRREPTLDGPDAYLGAVRDRGRALRQQFDGDPIGLALHLGLMLPKKPAQVMKELGLWDEAEDGEILPGLRDLVEDVCLLIERSAVAVGPRGGGKSMGVSFIEFYLWIIKQFEALNLGGSELQANNVYQYLLGYLEADEGYWSSLLKGEPKISETYIKEGSWIRVMAASQKSVRSPHAGGRRRLPSGEYVDRGGLLVIDEEAEADPEIVKAAQFTINTARPSVSVRSSTFHNVGGTFEEVVDNAEDMGYKKYQWDIFDVAEPCECIDTCQSAERCFREDHIETVINPETGKEEDILLHKAYCGGRSRYASGWVPQEEVHTMWTRIKRNHGVWEVEAMGSRPKSSGHVIKDQKKFLANFSDHDGSDLYLPGSPITICVDWGAVAAGVDVWQEHPGDQHKLLHSDLVEEAGVTQIIGHILGYWLRYPEAEEVACDIGGGGNYLNPLLRDEEHLPVRDVNFAEEKEAAAAAWNILNEGGHTEYGGDLEDFKTQGKNWKRKNGRIQKGNDHLMDAGLCYFAKFIDRLGLSNVRVLPRAFSTTGATRLATEDPIESRASIQRGRPVVRPVVIRSH